MTVTVSIGGNSDGNYYATLNVDGSTYTTTNCKVVKQYKDYTSGYYDDESYIPGYYTYYTETTALVNNIQHKFNTTTTSSPRCDTKFYYYSSNNSLYNLYTAFQGNTNDKSSATIVSSIYNNSTRIKELKQRSIKASTPDSNTTVFTFYNASKGKIGTVTYKKDSNSYTAEGGTDETTNYQNLAIIASAGFSDNYYQFANKDFNVVKAMYAMSSSVSKYI